MIMETIIHIFLLLVNKKCAKKHPAHVMDVKTGCHGFMWLMLPFVTFFFFANQMKHQQT